MTDTHGDARRIGSVHADGAEGDVYQQGDRVFSRGTNLVVTAEDREVMEETRSDDFPSLADFLRALPAGVRFVPSDEKW